MKAKLVGILVCMLLITTGTLSVVNAYKTTTQTLNPGMVDQEQNLTTEIDWLDGMDWQSFTNYGNMIEEVHCHIGNWWTGSTDITLSIHSDLELPALTSVTYPSSALPFDKEEWFIFDVPDINLKKATLHYMVITFDSGEYAWSGAYGNPYPFGEAEFDPDWDYAFRTIVDKSQSIPVNFPINSHPFMQMLFNCFPQAFPLLRQLIGY